MMFALGFVAGVAMSAFVAAVLAYFRHPIVAAMATTETKLANAGPRPRGFVYEPPSEADLAREEIVRKNAEQGRDTPISELQ